jgi:hypothetical protein
LVLVKTALQETVAFALTRAFPASAPSFVVDTVCGEAPVTGLVSV